MLKLKKGSDLSNFSTQALFAAIVVDQVYEKYGKNDVTITEVSGGKHGKSSVHYYGFAIDVRTWVLNDTEKVHITNELKDRLGEQFDIIMHDSHLHVEYDPRKALDRVL